NPLGRKCSKWLLAKRVIVGLLAIMLCIFSHAQEVMEIGSYTDIQRRGNKYIDMVLPTTETLPYGWIYLEARGADGGRRDQIFIDPHYRNGGEGAILGGWVKIEDDAVGCIPFGSTIRFIIGQHGDSYSSPDEFGSGGGGGGTGILFLPPNAVNDEWEHLIIASAGGGAYADTDGGFHGGGGHANPDEPSGKAGKGNISGGAGWKYGPLRGPEPGWQYKYENLGDWVKVDGKLKDISVAEDG
ncbi:MAG: hypothetical protein GY753_03690, partial [Gammaproteobacteria bacterium]|nr:hypothetical protein [Gammaproteobacteria bacterium]